MNITYVGPHDAVVVACPDGREVVVERGATVDVDDTLATGLLDQAANWKPAKARKDRTP